MRSIYTDQLRQFANGFDSFQAFKQGLEASDKYPMSFFRGYAERMQRSFFHLEHRFPGENFPHDRWIAAFPDKKHLSDFVSELILVPWDDAQHYKSKGWVFLSVLQRSEALESKFGFHYFAKPKFEFDKGHFYENYMESLKIGFPFGQDQFAFIAKKNHVRWLVSIVDIDLEPVEKDPIKEPSLPNKS